MEDVFRRSAMKIPRFSSFLLNSQQSFSEFQPTTLIDCLTVKQMNKFLGIRHLHDWLDWHFDYDVWFRRIN
jgi:hypothetical protein